MITNNDIPNGFDSPTALPESSMQNEQWQNDSRTWWEENPMRYDWKKDIGHKEFSKEFYLEINERFFSEARKFMPWKKIPFDPLINFSDLHDKNVLEIGVGNGSHAQLLAEHSKSYTGIDITDYAVKSTTERMKCLDLDGEIIRMDAEKMQFHDNSFDFIWSWGVIHHSSNTKQVLKEMHRVLKPGGRAVTMVYHKSFWNYYLMAGFFHGIIKGDLIKTRSLHRTVQKFTDGAMARYYTPKEWASFVSEFFSVGKIRIYGSKAEIVPLPGGKVKDMVMRLIPDNVGRLFTNQLKFGTFLVSELLKK